MSEKINRGGIPPPSVFADIDYPALIVYDLQGQRFEGAKVSLESRGDREGTWVLTIRLDSGELKSFTQNDVSTIRHY